MTNLPMIFFLVYKNESTFPMDSVVMGVYLIISTPKKHIRFNCNYIVYVQPIILPNKRQFYTYMPLVPTCDTLYWGLPPQGVLPSPILTNSQNNMFVFSSMQCNKVNYGYIYLFSNNNKKKLWMSLVQTRSGTHQLPLKVPSLTSYWSKNSWRGVFLGINFQVIKGRTDGLYRSKIGRWEAFMENLGQQNMMVAWQVSWLEREGWDQIKWDWIFWRIIKNNIQTDRLKYLVKDPLSVICHHLAAHPPLPKKSYYVIFWLLPAPSHFNLLFYNQKSGGLGKNTMLYNMALPLSL